MLIRVLPREISEKIAAGEVVERPASVIKELMENSLDARARRIEVTVGQSATDRLEVADNGVGMSPSEIPVALERHATSKIACEEDLFRIATLGFRGEALPSIAAVSDLRIETKTEDAALGVRLDVKAGVITSLMEVGMSTGTRVVVRNLFQTTPARLKFLSSSQTENGHVLDTFTRLALSRMDVGFSLKRADKDAILAPAVSELAQRAANLFGWELAERLRPLDTTDGGYRWHGLVGPPEIHRQGARGIFLFVNRRPIRDLMIMRALRNGYEGRLTTGRFPVAILFLDLPFAEVDVNAHPAKAEVHFSNARRVCNLLLQGVSRALEREPWVPGVPSSPRGQDYAPFSASPGAPAPGGASRPYQDVYSGTPGQTESAVRETLSPALAGPEAATAEVPSGIVPMFEHFRILGQFRRGYLVCEYGDRLLLVDQHAAHERIAYDRLEAAYARESVLRQALLVPAVVELHPREAECLSSHLERLAELGIDIEPYGGLSFVVKAVPALLAEADPGRLVQDVAEELVEMGRIREPDVLRARLFARMACHSVVRAGRSLEREEMEALLKSMDDNRGLPSCPHGRPVVIGWSLQEIEKRFQRIG